MGYLPNRALLVANLPVLLSLLTYVKRGEPLTFSYRPEDLGLAHYQFNRLLHSAQVFQDFEGGKFASLRSLIRFKVSPSDSTITAVPVQGAPSTLVRKTCLDALEELEADKTSTIRAIEFYPSEDFDPLEEDDLKRLYLQANEIGWLLHVKAVIVEPEDEGGLISIGVERKEVEETSGFDALRKRQTG